MWRRSRMARLRIVVDETAGADNFGKPGRPADPATVDGGGQGRLPDPGLRAQTVTILVGDADASDVREALAFAMANDENTNVRLKAMEGLQRYHQRPRGTECAGPRLTE